MSIFETSEYLENESKRHELLENWVDDKAHWDAYKKLIDEVYELDTRP